MKRKIFAFLLSVLLCLGLVPSAYAETTLDTDENGGPKLVYEDPNPLPPPPGSVEEEPVEEPVEEEPVEEEPVAAEPVEEPVRNPFDDVQPGSFYYDAVLWAVEQGSLTGSGQFGPNEICSRAETVTLLWRVAGSPKPVNSSNPFVDVLPGDYFYDAALWAVEQGITTGISTTKFSPYDTVNRAQTMTFIFRAVKAQDVGGGIAFADVPAGAYYAAPVWWAVSRGITTGNGDGTFGPNEGCTRAHIVTFLYRAQGQQ